MLSQRVPIKVVDLGVLTDASLRPRGRLTTKQSFVTYSFRLNQRSSLQANLSKIAKGANLDLEVWSTTGKLGQSNKKKNQNEQLSYNALEAGTYSVKILRKQGQSKYQLGLGAQEIKIDPIVTDQTVTDPAVTDPSISEKPDAVIVKPNDPIIPTLRSPSDIFEMGGSPDGIKIYFKIDFSKQDEDLRADFGLFRGAILSANVSATDPVAWGTLPYNFTNDPNPKIFLANNTIAPFKGINALDYQPGDVISFKNSTGQTEFRTILLSDDGYPLCIGLVATSNETNLPNSLSSLKTTLTITGKVKAVRFAMNLYGKNFREQGLQLETVNVTAYVNPYSLGSNSDYLMGSEEQNYTLTQNLDIANYENKPDPIAISNSIRSFGVIGNQLNNVITGNSARNKLNGYGKTVNDISQFDILIGGAGEDTFVLGEGSDVYYVESGDGYAVIQDWEPGIDKLQTANISDGIYTTKYISVDKIGDSRKDTEIYFSKNGIQDRIAILQDVEYNPFI